MITSLTKHSGHRLKLFFLRPFQTTTDKNHEQPKDIWPHKKECQFCINKAFSTTLVEFMSMFCSKVVTVPLLLHLSTLSHLNGAFIMLKWHLHRACMVPQGQRHGAQ